MTAADGATFDVAIAALWRRSKLGLYLDAPARAAVGDWMAHWFAPATPQTETTP